MVPIKVRSGAPVSTAFTAMTGKERTPTPMMVLINTAAACKNVISRGVSIRILPPPISDRNRIKRIMWSGLDYLGFCPCPIGITRVQEFRTLAGKPKGTTHCRILHSLPLPRHERTHVRYPKRPQRKHVVYDQNQANHDPIKPKDSPRIISGKRRSRRARAMSYAGVANDPMVVRAITTTVIGLANPADTAACPITSTPTIDSAPPTC